MLDKLRIFLSTATTWPDLDEEVGDDAKYLTGNILNAGAGSRDITPIIKGKLFNQDIPHGIHNERIHIYSPIDKIPVKDKTFDTIFCNAVLEHVKNPHEVMAEFHRVLKDEGHLYVAVPFMQPEHLDPTDFWRFTADGLKRIAQQQGFEVIKVEGTHNVYHTIGWIVQEWLTSKKTTLYRFLRYLLFPTLRYLSGHSKTHVFTISSGFKLVAKKRL